MKGNESADMSSDAGILISRRALTIKVACASSASSGVLPAAMRRTLATEIGAARDNAARRYDESSADGSGGNPLKPY
jgi:hypothetical protein